MEYWLPLFFIAAMGLALLMYVILDGYDLGIGILLPLGDETQKDEMIASIGPFWDANETWIVLGVGILLIAFPGAHGQILSSLYIPVTLMLIALIMRGVAFDFRVKAGEMQKSMWNAVFFFGSLLASVSQGWMLGSYITGLKGDATGTLFSVLLAVTFPALYIMLGSAWLMIKVDDILFQRATGWAKRAMLPFGLSLLLISVGTPLISSEIAARWFVLPNVIGLLPIPLIILLAYSGLVWKLHTLSAGQLMNTWLVYSLLVLICVMMAIGLAYSLFPDIIIGRMTIWDAASSVKSLRFTFWGVVVTLPMVLSYTVYVYRIFHGKSTRLSYE